jgi:hypothetical protein
LLTAALTERSERAMRRFWMIIFWPSRENGTAGLRRHLTPLFLSRSNTQGPPGTRSSPTRHSSFSHATAESFPRSCGISAARRQLARRLRHADLTAEAVRHRPVGSRGLSQSPPRACAVGRHPRPDRPRTDGTTSRPGPPRPR